ncbi:hypothetical protein L3081_20970 [Colwellia sp. MSW7]|uniref:Uncharacterized protein n=1 Tax=Colwellia maritima TaxID=2912588 RepID=A0ABS9X591_9GAMM|nr:hypothetical protein [Colwellia maritima]MCI2285403.1 hypothetical protein [Colwellia maritima]
MRFTIFIRFVVVMSSLFISGICVCNNIEPVTVMESFEQGIPDGLYATGGKLSLDSKRMKHKATSLRWDWVGNDRLIFDTPLGYHEPRDLKTIDKTGRDQYLFKNY